MSLSRPEAARAFLLKVQIPTRRDFNLKQTSLAFPVRGLMVELNGIEPLTPCLQSRCSPN